jgi:uncharacterized membrane protein YdjX (TVP38/TMEM64 family)
MITPELVRDWSDAAGVLSPLLFLVIHILVTITPFPRVVFTLSAGLLFGPILGIALAVTAATISAGLAFILVRALGRDRIAARLTHPKVRAIDRRLEHRGWLAVGSMRLIASIPFAIVNYCAALSSVRLVPYLLATAVGILPSTIGTAILGDSLTGPDPTLLIFSITCYAAGVILLIIDAKKGVPEMDRRETVGER